MSKLSKVELPWKYSIVNENGEISEIWRNALIDLQNKVNQLIVERNSI